MKPSEIKKIFGGNVTYEFRSSRLLSLVKARGAVTPDANRPIVGIVNPYSEVLAPTPAMSTLPVGVKAGLYLGGATPVVVRTLGLKSDPARTRGETRCRLPEPGSMARSLGAVARNHRFDAMVLMPNCGKIALGMLIAAAKTNLPAIFDCGHLVLTGLNPEVSERTASERTDFRPGEDEGVVRIGAQFRPDCQSCWGWREAHAVKVLIEALGMALPDSSAGPPGLASRFRLAKRAGRNIVELWRQGIKTSDILTPDAFRNGLTVGLALGCAPKTLQYLMAMAEEAGIRPEAHVLDQLSTRTRQASS